MAIGWSESLGTPVPAGALPRVAENATVRRLDTKCAAALCAKDEPDGYIDPDEAAAAMRLDRFAPGKSELHAKAIERVNAAKAQLNASYTRIAHAKSEIATAQTNVSRYARSSKTWNTASLLTGVAGGVTGGAGMVLGMPALAGVAASVPWLAPMFLVMAGLCGVFGLVGQIVRFILGLRQGSAERDLGQATAALAQFEQALERAKQSLDLAWQELAFTTPPPERAPSHAGAPSAALASPRSTRAAV